MDVPSRRDVLIRAGRWLGAGSAITLMGAAGPSDLRIVQLQTPGNWNPRPTALRRLLWEVAQRTSIEVDLEPVSRPGDDPELFHDPMLYWAGDASVPRWSDDALKRLRRHLTFGGVLLVDSADGSSGFDGTVRDAVGRLFPRLSFERIPEDHVIYKSFYLVAQTAGRKLRAPYLEGLKYQDRYAIIYSQNDLGGAWARDAFGRWEYEVTPGGERQREVTFRLGVNLAMYGLCLDYKDDLVHTPFILRRRR